MTWTLYGSPISLFTRKLEAALEYYALDFESVRKDDSNRVRLEARAGTHQIPVLETPYGWTLADSTQIMLWLDALYPARRLFPDRSPGVLVHVIEEILDEWVARVMVHYRWHYPENTRFVIEFIAGQEVDADTASRHPLALWGPRACRATGTADVSQQRAAEAEYLALMAALERQLGLTRYALGDRPTAVDAALIGGLRGHTLHDPLPAMDAFPRVCAWAAQTQRWDGEGHLAPLPESTPFARHMLALAGAQYRPFVLGNRAARARGDKAFTATTYGEEVSYLARAYPEISREMLAHRIAHGLEREERGAVHAWLAACGLDDCFS